MTPDRPIPGPFAETPGPFAGPGAYPDSAPYGATAAMPPVPGPADDATGGFPYPPPGAGGPGVPGGPRVPGRGVPGGPPGSRGVPGGPPGGPGGPRGGAGFPGMPEDPDEPGRRGVPPGGARQTGRGGKRGKGGLKPGMAGVGGVLDKLPRSPMALTLYAAAAFVLVAGGGAFFALDHSYTLSIDGKTREVSSFSSNVNDVLTSENVKVGNDDVVYPDAGSSVGSGDTIVVRHAHPLTITMDGKTRTVMTTALNVGEALDQLRLNNSAVLNASRSRELPTNGGFQLNLRGPKRVIILLDQVRLETETTATTVAGVLQESGIKLGDHDKVNKKLSAAPKADMVLKVRQVISKPVTKTVNVDPPVKEKKDSTMSVGDKKVIDKGKPGVKEVLTAYVMERGHKVRKVIAATWKRKPEPKIVKVGTKPAMAAGGGGGPVPSGSPQAIAKQLLEQRGWGDQFSCLDNLYNKESHWNVHASNPSGAYGIPQALPGSKMASAGPNWQDNPETQIKWGLGYISDRYGTPCGAWAHSESSGWY